MNTRKYKGYNIETGAGKPPYPGRRKNLWLDPATRTIYAYEYGAQNIIRSDADCIYIVSMSNPWGNARDVQRAELIAWAELAQEEGHEEEDLQSQASAL